MGTSQRFEESTRLWTYCLVSFWPLASYLPISRPRTSGEGGVLTRYRPEDILGSVEVDGHGDIIGNFQPSGTYRIITNEGM